MRLKILRHNSAKVNAHRFKKAHCNGEVNHSAFGMTKVVMTLQYGCRSESGAQIQHSKDHLYNQNSSILSIRQDPNKGKRRV